MIYNVVGTTLNLTQLHLQPRLNLASLRLRTVLALSITRCENELSRVRQHVSWISRR